MKKGGDVKPNNVVYTTEEQYKADLLNPWSKEKAKAQSDWNKKKLNAERLNAVNVYKSINPDFVDPNAYDSEKEKTRKIVQSHYGAGGTEQKPLYSEEAEINKWTGQKAQQKKREEQTNMMMTGVAAAPLVYGAGALALQGASAAMAIPEVSGGINAYFGMQGIKNVPKTIEAWKDPNVSTIDAVGQTSESEITNSNDNTGLAYYSSGSVSKDYTTVIEAHDAILIPEEWETVFGPISDNTTNGIIFDQRLKKEATIEYQAKPPFKSKITAQFSYTAAIYTGINNDLFTGVDVGVPGRHTNVEFPGYKTFSTAKISATLYVAPCEHPIAKNSLNKAIFVSADYTFDGTTLMILFSVNLLMISSTTGLSIFNTLARMSGVMFLSFVISPSTFASSVVNS